jgi:hypothetical protein
MLGNHLTLQISIILGDHLEPMTKQVTDFKGITDKLIQAASVRKKSRNFANPIANALTGNGNETTF